MNLIANFLIGDKFVESFLKAFNKLAFCCLWPDCKLWIYLFAKLFISDIEVQDGLFYYRNFGNLRNLLFQNLSAYASYTPTLTNYFLTVFNY